MQLSDPALYELSEPLRRSLERAGATEKWIELPHGPARYLEAGSGPPLVALHGFARGSGADRWLAHMPAWSKRFRVIALDLLGWGAGARPKFEYSSPSHMLQAIRDTLDLLEIERCFLVGHCFGGRLSLHFTAHSPHRVRALVVAAIGTRGQENVLETQGPGRPLASIEEARDLIRRRMGDLPGVDYEEFARWTWRSRELNADFVTFFATFIKHFTDSSQREQLNVLRNTWSMVNTPILFAWPTADVTAPLEDSTILLETIKTSSIRLCEGNHFFVNQYANEFAQVVNEFFDDAMIKKTA